MEGLVNLVKRAPRAVLLALGLSLLLIGNSSAQQSLSIGSDSVAGLGSIDLPVTLTSTAPTEGFVLAIGFDSQLVAASEFSVVGTVTEAAGAELVVPEILPSEGATLGVVMDVNAPFDAQTIPVGTDQLIAVLTVNANALVTVDTPTPISFEDGTLNNPPLDNILVQGGLSIGAGAGLGLNDGTLTLLIPPPDTLSVASTSTPSNQSGTIQILMSNQTGDVQGFALAVAHDDAVLDLEAIDLTGTVTEAQDPELTIPQLYANGGTLGVVLDFTPPFDGQVIAVGVDQHIANFTYSSDNELVDPDPAITTDILLVNGLIGVPALDNVIVVGGLSLRPALVSGTYTSLPVAPPPLENTQFYCGSENLPVTGDTSIEATAGAAVEICFFYSDPDDNLQGFQIAACVDCHLTMTHFTLGNSILVDLQTEFVSFDIDNDPNDGDGCEFIAGILLDALPPFLNQTAPASADPLLIGCLLATVSESAPCDADLPVLFCNDIDGTGDVLIENIAVIDFQSIQDFEQTGCLVHVIPEEVFQRGDCNSDDKVNLADAATVLGQQFLGVPVLCPDACDANDDGSINLADSVYLLNYLFKFGPDPADPGPLLDGPDPTFDLLPACMSDDSSC
ncbi:MAG: dockerin type I repeat-containing protein [Planctomycetota bacterium]